MIKYSTNDEIFRLTKHQIPHQIQNIPLKITTINENNNEENSFQF